MGYKAILKHYVTLTQDAPWQVHYRTTGERSNPVVVLLHPSPMSSASMVSIMNALSDNFYVIAADTPGYGQSDPIPDNFFKAHEGRGALVPYVEALRGFFDALGLDKTLIYGSATGAQIAIEYAKAYPHSVRGLVLDNAAWFYDDERQAILEQYFPDIKPTNDGAHLSLVWKMSRQLFQFFPWYDTSDDARISNVQMPAELIHETLMGYLTAGNNYHLAYRGAFLNERPEQLAQVTVPTRIIRWPDSLLKRYVDRLDNADLPPNIIMHKAASGVDGRFSALNSALKILHNSQENQG